MLPRATAVVAERRCQVSHLGRRLEFDLGTVAGMKSETHAASLIIESYGAISMKFGVLLGMGYIAEIAPTKLKSCPRCSRDKCETFMLRCRGQPNYYAMRQTKAACRIVFEMLLKLRGGILRK